MLGHLDVKGPQGWVGIEQAKGLGLQPEEVRARVVPSELGLAMLAALDEMPRIEPQVEILARQVMPDHFHFIVFVKSPIERPLGSLIRGFKAGASKRWKSPVAEDPVAENGHAQHQRNSGVVPASGELLGGVVPASGGLPGGAVSASGGLLRGAVPAHSWAGLWAPGFQDTLLLRDGQLANMKHYLADNPRRLAIKRLFPDVFRKVRELGVNLQVAPGKSASGRFSVMGNQFLLERPMLQVQVSRREFSYRREPKPGGGFKIVRDSQGLPVMQYASPGYAAKRQALFAAAGHGAVLLSPCVSDGERQLALEALMAGLPLITMRNKGFAPLQKPVGRYFDACAAGRLLMLAPVAWPYLPGEKPMTRFDATAMNRLCQWMAGEGAAIINYHGMQPENIDALAAAAVRLQSPMAE